MKSSTRKAHRETKAIHYYYCRDMSLEEIAEKLDVSKPTASRYINSEPSEEVERMLNRKSKQVRIMAVEELRKQLRVAGEQSRTAEKPVKVWEDDDGNLTVKDQRDEETGEITGKYPIPNDIEMLPDETTRYYRREEVRDIIDQMADLVGAKEAEQHEIEHTGIKSLSSAFINNDDSED